MMEAIQLEQAVELLTENCLPITETEMITIDNIEGRILAQDIIARINQPPFPRSPLDGYAIRAEDSVGASKDNPVALKVIDEVYAGGWSDREVIPGTAIRIMTGAPIPRGADCILMQEDTDYGTETVKIYRSLKAWQNYCYEGEDFKQGTIILKAGQQLGAAEIGVMAGNGIEEIPVYRKPRVLVMSTGTELVRPGQPLRPGQIYDSNLYMLVAQLKLWNVEIISCTSMQDDPEEAAAYIRENAGNADLILSTGGVSVGKKDIMHDVFRIINVQRLFWKVRLKPGSPTLCGLYDGKPFIALSGNPYGAIANLHLLGRPLLVKMTGRSDLEIRKAHAVFDTGFPKKSPVTRYVRGVYKDGHAWSSGANDSGVLSSFIGCNCMIVIPAGTMKVDPGESVEVILL